jgi:hypothetical protein
MALGVRQCFRMPGASRVSIDSGLRRYLFARKVRVIVSKGRRFTVVIATLVVLMFALASAVSAVANTGSVSSKTINTSTGECTKDANGDPVLVVGGGPCGSATYTDSGFTGTIYGTGSLNIVDYICVGTPSSGFSSFGGTYILTLYDASNAPIGTATYLVPDGVACTAGTNAAPLVTGLFVDFGANGGSVTYSLTIDGVSTSSAQTTFTGYNSLLNRVVGIGDAQANSPSVAPPGPAGQVPEAPAAVLLVLSAALVGFLFIRHQSITRKASAA